MPHEFHSFYYDQMQREPSTDDFRLPAGTEMTEGLLQRLVDEFEQDHKPRYEYLDKVYDTHYAIFDRSWRRKPDYKPDNRLSADFCYTITDTFEGYYIGVPMTLSVKGDDEGRKKAVEAFIADYTARNFQEDVDAELSEMASKFGHAYEMLYQDDEGLPRSVAVSAHVVHGLRRLRAEAPHVLRPLVLRRRRRDKGQLFRCPRGRSVQRGDAGLVFGEPEGHSFGSVPAVDFRQNTKGRGLYKGVLSMVEQYNAVLSEKGNDVEYFSDCYMVVKGKELNEDEIEHPREQDHQPVRRLAGGPRRAVPGEAQRQLRPGNLINRLEQLIFKMAMVPDITSDSFVTASGIALKMRMMPMSNLARKKDRKFKRGVQERLKLLAAYPLSQGFSGDDWKAVEVTMHRNMPTTWNPRRASPGSCRHRVRGDAAFRALLREQPEGRDAAQARGAGREGRRDKRRHADQQDGAADENRDEEGTDDEGSDL